MIVKPIILIITDEISKGVSETTKNYEPPAACLCYRINPANSALETQLKTVEESAKFGSWSSINYYGPAASIISEVSRRCGNSPYFIDIRLNEYYSNTTSNYGGFLGLKNLLEPFFKSLTKGSLYRQLTAENKIPHVTAVVDMRSVYDSHKSTTNLTQEWILSVQNTIEWMNEYLGYRAMFINKYSDINDASVTGANFWHDDGVLNELSSNYNLNFGGRNWLKAAQIALKELHENEGLNYYLCEYTLDLPNKDDGGYYYSEEAIIDVGIAIGEIYVDHWGDSGMKRDSIEIYNTGLDITDCYLYYDQVQRNHSYFSDPSFIEKGVSEGYLTACPRIFDNLFKAVFTSDFKFNYLIFYNEDIYLGFYKFGSNQLYEEQMGTADTTTLINIETIVNEGIVSEVSVSLDYKDHMNEPYDSESVDEFYTYSQTDTLIENLADSVGSRVAFTSDVDEESDIGDRLTLYETSSSTDGALYQIFRDRDGSCYLPLVRVWGTPELIREIFNDIGSSEGYSFTTEQVYGAFNMSNDYVFGAYLYTIVTHDSGIYLALVGTSAYTAINIYNIKVGSDVVKEIQKCIDEKIKVPVFTALNSIIINVGGKVYKSNILSSKIRQTETIGNQNITVFQYNTNTQEIFSDIGYIYLPDWYDFWYIGYCIVDNKVYYLPCDAKTKDDLLDPSEYSQTLESYAYTQYNPGPRYECNNLNANYYIGAKTLERIYPLYTANNIHIGDNCIYVYNPDIQVLNIHPLSYKYHTRKQIVTNGDEVVFLNNGIIVRDSSTGTGFTGVYTRYDEGESYSTSDGKTTKQVESSSKTSFTFEGTKGTSIIHRCVWFRGVSIQVYEKYKKGSTSEDSKFRLRTYAY